MLKPNLTRELVPSSPTTVLAAGDKIVWNPLTPVEDLPQALKQLREAQQRVNRLVQDADAQVVHFLRYGPFSNYCKYVKRSIELFYNFSEAALRENVDRLDPLVV